jgi:SAM-dependent methyltransferase
MTDPSPPKDPLTEPGPWNAVATGYDEVFFGQLPELAENAFAILAPPASAHVLDVATGPGTLAVRLAPRVARVTAIDFAEKMVERLRARIGEAGATNVAAHVMDGEALGFSDGSFDAVVSMFGWFLFSDRRKSLAEMHRVLRPGGRVLVTSWSTIDRNTVLGEGLQALREALPNLPRPAGPLPTQIPENCAAEVRDAGFSDVRTDVVTLPARYGSVEEYWQMMERASAPFVVLQKKLGDAAFGQALEKTHAILRSKFGDGPVTLYAEAIFTSGTR